MCMWQSCAEIKDFICRILQLHHHIHILVQSWPPEMCSTQHFHSCCTWVIPVELLQHLCLQYLWNINDNMNDELQLSYVFLSLTVVDCGNLTDPANGQVKHTSGTTFGENATYSCNTGYNLVGDMTRTCQATGNWSGSAPTCQSMLLKDDLTLFKCAYTQET